MSHWVAREHAKQYPGLTEEQIWVLEFCGIAACEYLIEKYSKQSGNPVRVDAVRITNHKGRTGTARKLFEKHGLIEPSYSDFLTPIFKKVEEICLKEGVAPTFDMDGCDTKKEPHVSRIQSYKVLKYLKARELMYVYTHQDEYDFYSVGDTDSFGKTNTKTLKVFSKKDLPTLEANILKARITEYARGHVREVLPKIIGYTLRALHNNSFAEIHDDEDGFLTNKVNHCAHCDEKEPLTNEALTERIGEAARQMRFLRRTIRELLDLRRYVRQHGEEKIIETAEEHLMYQAPLWINVPDRKLREFAKALLSGVNVVESD